MKTKACLLMVVDALAYRIVTERFRSSSLPNMHRLVKAGGSLRPCTSIFPSITPAATCSIVTGCYPVDHGIEGAYWFDRENEEIAYFGDNLMVALQRGLHQYLLDFGDRLNFERLKCPTLFEQLDEKGIDSACINYLWFAGPHEHPRLNPLMLRLMAGKMPQTVRGPRYLKLGDFVESLPENTKPLTSSGMFGRYGFSDEVTSQCLLNMAEADKIPPFTLAYFPSNDDLSHKEGPDKAADQALNRFDDFLGAFIQRFGGWRRLGEKLEIIIVGDHAQDEFREAGPQSIDIDQCLSDFQLASPGGGWSDGDEMFVCPNMRAAAVYIRTHDCNLISRVRQSILREEGVDQVITLEGESEWRVATADRGSLTFRRGAADSPDVVADPYGNHWQLDGQLACVDATVDEHGLQFGDYPNAFERIAGAFVPGSRPVWITARVGAEFRTWDTSTHGGGSHASLHAVDSNAALLTSSGIQLSLLPCPVRPRITDVARLVRNAVNSAPSQTGR